MCRPPRGLQPKSGEGVRLVPTLVVDQESQQSEALLSLGGLRLHACRRRAGSSPGMAHRGRQLTGGRVRPDGGLTEPTREAGELGLVCDRDHRGPRGGTGDERVEAHRDEQPGRGCARPCLGQVRRRWQDNAAVKASLQICRYRMVVRSRGTDTDLPRLEKYL